jgi:hypothetical protein
VAVDHFDGTGPSDRRCNRRICVRLQNSQNSRRARACKTVEPTGEFAYLNIPQEARR